MRGLSFRVRGERVVGFTRLIPGSERGDLVALPPLGDLSAASKDVKGESNGPEVPNRRGVNRLGLASRGPADRTADAARVTRLGRTAGLPTEPVDREDRIAPLPALLVDRTDGAFAEPVRMLDRGVERTEDRPDLRLVDRPIEPRLLVPPDLVARTDRAPADRLVERDAFGLDRDCLTARDPDDRERADDLADDRDAWFRLDAADASSTPHDMVQKTLMAVTTVAMLLRRTMAHLRV